MAVGAAVGDAVGATVCEAVASAPVLGLDSAATSVGWADPELVLDATSGAAVEDRLAVPPEGAAEGLATIMSTSVTPSSATMPASQRPRRFDTRRASLA
jgi:hypothetical protein